MNPLTLNLSPRGDSKTLLPVIQRHNRLQWTLTWVPHHLLSRHRANTPPSVTSIYLQTWIRQFLPFPKDPSGMSIRRSWTPTPDPGLPLTLAAWMIARVVEMVVTPQSLKLPRSLKFSKEGQCKFCGSGYFWAAVNVWLGGRHQSSAWFCLCRCNMGVTSLSAHKLSPQTCYPVKHSGVFADRTLSNALVWK